MEENWEESRLEGKGRSQGWDPYMLPCGCSREWQGLRIRVVGCPEKVDSQQRPWPQTGPETENPPPFMRSGQWAYPCGQSGPSPECSVMRETPVLLDGEAGEQTPIDNRD